jgi:hypothetical protein
MCRAEPSALDASIEAGRAGDWADEYAMSLFYTEENGFGLMIPRFSRPIIRRPGEIRIEFNGFDHEFEPFHSPVIRALDQRKRFWGLDYVCDEEIARLKTIENLVPFQMVETTLAKTRRSACLIQDS